MSQEKIEESFGRLNKLANDVFFARLSQHGIVPQNDAEADDLVKLATQVRPLAEKRAADAGSRFSALTSSLDADPNVKAANEQQAQVAFDLQVEKIASELATDGDLNSAVISIKQAQAEQLKKQLAG